MDTTYAHKLLYIYMWLQWWVAAHASIAVHSSIGINANFFGAQRRVTLKQ